MLAWWMLLPTLLAMMVALVLPGFMWLRAGGRSSLVAIGAAPAFTFGLITILSVAYPVLGIEWEPSTALPILGMSALGGAGAWSLSFFRRSNDGFSLRGVPLREAIGVRKPIGGRQAAIRAATWGAILVGFSLAALPLVMGAAPSNPVQQWDPTFHQNGVHAMLYSKNASPFGGLHELYGGRNVYYPTGWHAFVSLFARYDSVVQVWVIGLAALVSVLTASRSAIMAAPIIGGMLLNMPADALTMYNQWPNSTGTALVPGLSAIAIVAGRRLVADLRAGDGLRAFMRRIPQAFFLLIGAIGLVGAHPSAAFSILAFLIAPLLASIASLARRAYGRGGRGQLIALAWGALALVVVAVPLLALSSSKIRAMGSYNRKGSNWGEAFMHAFLPYPPFSNTSGNIQWTIVQFILLLVGIAATARLYLLFRRRDPLERAVERAGLTDETDADAEEGALASAQEIEESEEEAQPLPCWPLFSYAILAALTALAYSPDSALRTYLLAPWYKDARRIMGVEDIALTILMAVGVAAIVRLIHAAWTRSLQRILAERGADDNIEAPRWPIQFAVGLLVLVLSGFGAIDARNAAVAQVYDPNRLGKPGMATMGELAMLRRMPYTTAPDALILGDPMIGGRKAVFPQLSTANKDVASQKLLIQRFHDIATDPEVCEVVRRLGITHFYEEEDGAYYNFMRSSRHPGLYNVDTSTGFELVDAGGTAKLWKITACGDVTPGGGREAFATGVTGDRD